MGQFSTPSALSLSAWAEPKYSLGRSLQRTFAIVPDTGMPEETGGVLEDLLARLDGDEARGTGIE